MPKEKLQVTGVKTLQNGEEKIWLKYVILVDGIDDLMEGVESNE